MFTKKTQHDSGLQKAIDNVLSEMTDVRPDTEQYATMVDQLTKLYSLKDIDRPKGVSPDTLTMVAGNLLGIMVIVGHERAHVVTSKALNFVMKLR